MAVLAEAAGTTETLAELIRQEERQFLARQPRSHVLTERAEQCLAGGATSSWMIARPGTVWVSHGAGSKVYDADGTEYVDLHGGYGVMLVGHAHPAVVEAVSRRVRLGHPLRPADRGRHRRGRAAGRALRPAALALLQLGHRGHHGRHPPDAGHHRAGPDHQDRGQLPRPPRLGDGQLPQRARRARAPRAAVEPGWRVGHPAGHARPRGRGALQRPRGARGPAARLRGPGRRHDPRADDDERRHHPAAARLPGGCPGAHPAPRRAAWPSTRSRPG